MASGRKCTAPTSPLLTSSLHLSPHDNDGTPGASRRRDTFACGDATIRPDAGADATLPACTCVGVAGADGADGADAAAAGVAEFAAAGPAGYAKLLRMLLIATCERAEARIWLSTAPHGL